MRFAFAAVSTLAATFFCSAWSITSPQAAKPGLTLFVSSRDTDAVCASCHKAIYDRYHQTPMANASGPVLDGLIQGGFRHPASGVDYKVFLRGGEAIMSYRRPGSSLDGERKLLYFIGSGHRGRTYLYKQQDLWFEAPINYYSKKALWDMAPNYGNSSTMPADLPVDPNCLHCHATEVQPSLPAARNRFADEPFRQGGIGCSACHGDPNAHLAANGHGAIVNPSKLSPARRDSTCLQCHLEGDAAIYRAGKSLADFHAGEDLSDYVTYFVKEGREAGGGRAASQYEALLRSKCKIASGDALTCTTCHDPHGSPSPTERVAFFRARCLACHTSPAMASMHHPEQQDCAVCHMPTRNTTDISHEQTTDHNIQRYPSAPSLRLSSLAADDDHLLPVGTVPSGDRELGLAYAQFAQAGDRVAAQRALQLLRRAESAGADDAVLHSQLGLTSQLAGNTTQALAEYDLALHRNPYDSVPLSNKAVVEASAGHTALAARLLRTVVENDPAQLSAGMNLAYIDCVAGNAAEANKILRNLRTFAPDDPTLLHFLQDGSYAGGKCNLSPPAASIR